jgi:Kelch motif protein
MTARISHTATLLSNGKVLAVAGFNNDPVNSTQRSTELYNPVSETWTPTAELNVLRGNHAATLLVNGRVLVTGGNGGGSPALASAELFDSTTAVPQITGASISGKALFVEGRNFEEGAKVFLNDEPQKTANETATTLLRCKKAGKQIARGATVRLKVRNSDGTESAEFSFTRPVE